MATDLTADTDIARVIRKGLASALSSGDVSLLALKGPAEVIVGQRDGRDYFSADVNVTSVVLGELNGTSVVEVGVAVVVSERSPGGAGYLGVLEA